MRQPAPVSGIRLDVVGSAGKDGAEKKEGTGRDTVEVRRWKREENKSKI